MAKSYKDLTPEERIEAYKKWMASKPKDEDNTCNTCEGTGTVSCPDCEGSGIRDLNQGKS
jgi:DnaJ-class molecular chaperone